MQNRVRVAVIPIGGAADPGVRGGEMVTLVAETVQSVLVPNSGRFVAEERPEQVVRHVLAATVSQSEAKPSLNVKIFIAIPSTGAPR